MKSIKSQRGFSAAAVVLTIVVLAVIGFAGWKVYDNHQTKGQSAKNNTQAVDPLTVGTSTLQADGSIKYDNKALGLAFILPKALVGYNPDTNAQWTKITVEQDTFSKSIGGKAYTIGSLPMKTAGGFVTKDWRANQPPTQGGFIKYDSCSGSEDTQASKTTILATKPLYEVPGDVCVKVVTINNTGPDGNYDSVVLEKVLKKNSQVAGVEMTFYQTAVGYLTANLTDPIVVLAKSMHEL